MSTLFTKARAPGRRTSRIGLWSATIVALAGATAVGCGGDDPAPAAAGETTLPDGGVLLPDGATVPGTNPGTGNDSGTGTTSDGGHGGTPDGSVPPHDAAPPGNPGNRPGAESWVWVFTDWAASLAGITANKAAFTHVSPTFYTLNYSYASGVTYYSNCPNSGGNYICTGAGTDNFDGMTSKAIAKKVTDLGLAVVPAIYAGANNGGTDDGIVAIMNDAGVQSAFITAMVAEAVAKGYSGYNLDFELAQSIGSAYVDKFISFVNAFKAELAKHSMSLSLDIISANINGTWCSGSNGFADLPKLQASSIDRVIIEDYGATLGGPSTTCQKKTVPISCPPDIIGFFDIMCTYMTYDKIVIGLDSKPSATNPIAGGAFGAMRSYGITKVAVWPDGTGSYVFLDPASINPAGTTWYALLEKFLLP